MPKRPPRKAADARAGAAGNAKAIEKTKAETVEDNARILQTRLKQSGLNTRVKGHQRATARRTQAKRDGP